MTGPFRVACGLLLFNAIGAAGPVLAERGAEAATDPEIVQLEGRAECLLPEDALQSPDADCNQPGAPFAFRTSDDRLFYLIVDDPKSEVFIDPRIRHQPILLEGWIRPQQRFEILMVYTLIEGQPHHVHYRCDVCDIDATAPGPCWCCGQEFDLRQPEASPTSRPRG